MDSLIVFASRYSQLLSTTTKLTEFEDELHEAENIKMMVDRKSNSKRKDEAYIAFLKTHMRKKIESVFSELERYLPNHIHAVTAKGFMLKVFIFLFAFTLDKINAT